jgi:hypothetical protein
MPEQLPDNLKRLLDQASMFHPARIWGKASQTYDTKISYRKGVVFGGSISPFFLQEREATPKMGWAEVGGTTLGRSRIILAETVPESANLNEWLTFLQTIAKEREGLFIVVTSFLHEEILSTLLINNMKNILQVVVAKHPRSEAIKKVPTTTLPTLSRLQLPIVSGVWIRKDSSVVFQDRTIENPLPTAECAVIEVGGVDINDINRRLSLLNDVIANMSAEDTRN